MYEFNSSQFIEIWGVLCMNWTLDYLHIVVCFKSIVKNGTVQITIFFIDFILKRFYPFIISEENSFEIVL